MDCFLFKDLSDSQIESAKNCFSDELTAEKGKELYRHGSLGLLIDGKAKIVRYADSGEKITVRSVYPGECFGAASVFGNWKMGSSSVIAEIGCKVKYISEDSLKLLFEKFPAVSFNYISYLSEKVRFLNRRLDMFSAGNAEQKIYEFLLTSADENSEVEINYSLSELARRLKIGRTSLYRGLDSLEKTGIIKRNKNIFKLI